MVLEEFATTCNNVYDDKERRKRARRRCKGRRQEVEKEEVSLC